MTQFQLRDLFALILLVGVALVWLFPSQNGIPARALLDAKTASEDFPNFNFNISRRPDEELIRIFELEQWAKISELVGSPYSSNRGMDITIEPPWLNSPVSFNWESDRDDPQGGRYVKWNADWNKIEEQNILTQRKMIIRVTLTVLAGMFLLWLYIPRKSKISN